MEWLLWVSLGLIAANVLFFAVLIIIYLKERRNWRD
jgi:hypothetical protein